MSDPGELFEKADALLGRYRGEVRAASGTAAEPDFPVLTEIVETVPAAGEPAPAEAPAAPAVTEPANASTSASPALDDGLDRIESRLLEQLQQDLGGLVDAAFESGIARLDEQMRAALRVSMDEAMNEIESRLQKQLGKAVQDAVGALRARGRGP